MFLLGFAILLIIGGALIRGAIKAENPYIDTKKAGSILMISGIALGVLAAIVIALVMWSDHGWDRTRFGGHMGPHPGIGYQRGVPVQPQP